MYKYNHVSGEVKGLIKNNIMRALEDLLKKIQSINESIDQESDFIEHRKSCLNDEQGLVKTAHDARFVNQDDYHPRKNLKYYNRTDSFIKDPVKVRAFLKLKLACNEIDNEYRKHQEYDDSYARILKNAVNNLLSKTKEGQFTYSEKNLSYFEQLIFNRYRLTVESINDLSKADLKKIVLAKDECLMYSDLFNEGLVKKASVNKEVDPMDEVEDFVNSLNIGETKCPQ